jgi:hypothetical protein
MVRISVETPDALIEVLRDFTQPLKAYIWIIPVIRS